MRYTAPKLHKVGEYGHGRVILCIYSGGHFHPHAFLPASDLDKSKKLHVYFLDLNREKKHSNEALVDTLNKFHFAESILVDFPTFIRICENFQKISSLQKGLEKLVLFNPIRPRSTLVRRFLGYKYINLNNETLKLNKTKLFQIYNFYKNVPEISIKKFDIISLQDIKASIKVGSFFKNSRLSSCKTYDDAIKAIHNLI